ncbi:minimal PKS ketosynthase (KS/KS alpha) [Saccharopolyspora antimicrobica]|uniref:Minimal PKS ketosynthase (KS/KS alpha) n=1 Tax=Saccharopolyspora antimicrobica TaxID=455193 RepID=A0A1I5GRL5_9PSEU|nr:beta-ketoacyl-[acyl-carrier-protein] synthase family protein [Saccharopolyspora antimicrobica]RKT87394.1 minimal PKS ketosynthase (KS/KS alpha) [Saccharopolyspora antimicrobica]SFO38496.1 minimal PKS ketosynthase (KS/KS alpha) [Saccharopolyspora antimicrobica]
MTHRVAVTGLGVVAPGGVGAKACWELLTSGRTATRGISLFPADGFRSRIAAECDFDGAENGLTAAEITRMDRYVQFAAVAVDEAWGQAGLEVSNPWRVGVCMGSAVGGTTQLEHDYVATSDSGDRWVVDHARASRYLHLALTPSTLAAEVAGRVGARGIVQTISTGCTAGLDAVGHAARHIQEGRADVMVAGASESPISPIAVACFDAIRATSARNDDAEHAARPFDLDRDGFVIGEGAAVLVLEEWEHALGRSAPVLAEIVGFANRSNAYHMTGLRTDGAEMAEAIRCAMDQARLADIDYVNAHGSGTRQNDRHETAAFKRALGQAAYAVPVSSIKSMVGHSLGAIGAIEALACVLALVHDVVPPTANLDTADPECDLDYVPHTAREQVLRTALSVGSGFGGFQSALVLSKARRS